MSRIEKLAVTGGVAANSALRAALMKMGSRYGFDVIIPDATLCTDNAAMIALAGLMRFDRNRKSDLTLDATAQLPICES